MKKQIFALSLSIMLVLGNSSVAFASSDDLNLPSVKAQELPQVEESKTENEAKSELNEEKNLETSESRGEKEDTESTNITESEENEGDKNLQNEESQSEESPVSAEEKNKLEQDISSDESEILEKQEETGKEDTRITEEEAIDTAETLNAKAVQLVWPVPGHTNLSQGFHDGNAIDISDGSIAGARVVAAIGGTVTHIYLCGSQHYGSNHTCNGFGTGLVIAGDDGRIYQYAHMQGGSIPSNVYRTARVEAGQTIGAVGTTGNSTGNHLHFGISIGNYWNASGINPKNENYTYGSPEISTSWEVNCSLADTTNAVINGKISVNQRVQFTNAGAYVWDPAGNLIAQPSETTTVSGTYMNIKYDMGMELGIWLNPGTTYTYQFWAVTGGKTYYSGKGTFNTIGTTPIQEVQLSKNAATMKEGENITLSATVLPSYANNKNVTWSSSNTNVATVSGGNVKAVGVGKAIITAKSHDGKSATCTVTVEKKEIVVSAVTPSITGRAPDALRLGWKQNTNADGYIIEQYNGKSWTRIARIGTNTTVTYRVEKLNPSTVYQFRMKAFKMDGNEAFYSSYVNVSGKTNPSNMAGVKIGGRAADALRINWTKNTTASGYIIEQYKDGKWVRIARIADNSTVTYRVEKLNVSTTYKFRIQAFNFEGNTALYGNYTNISGKTNPSNMAGVKIGGRAADALRINWTKNTTASGYIIEQYKDGKWVRIARIADNSTVTYRVEKLNASTTYKFRIQAFNFEGSIALYGNYTNISGKTNPSKIEGLKIGGRATDALRLNWTKNTTASGYIIEQYKDGKWVRIARIANNNTVTYRVEKLSSSTTYLFRVQAFNFEGQTPLYGTYSTVLGTTYMGSVLKISSPLDVVADQFDKIKIEK